MAKIIKVSSGYTYRKILQRIGFSFSPSTKVWSLTVPDGEEEQAIDFLKRTLKIEPKYISVEVEHGSIVS